MGATPRPALAATVDGRFLEAIRDVAARVDDELAHLAETLAPAGEL